MVIRFTALCTQTQTTEKILKALRSNAFKIFSVARLIGNYCKKRMAVLCTAILFYLKKG